jgi:hypothetical protein
MRSNAAGHNRSQIRGIPTFGTIQNDGNDQDGGLNSIEIMVSSCIIKLLLCAFFRGWAGKVVKDSGICPSARPEKHVVGVGR